MTLPDGWSVAPAQMPAGWDRNSAPPLPIPLTSLVGREPDVAAVLAMLAAGQRLVTITGPGGVGKSRLALAVAADADSPDGVWFVPLAAIREAAQVLPAIGRQFGLSESGRPIADRLRDHLRDRRLLLLLDNFEQVVDAAGPIANLIAATPTLTVLVTSRVPLRVSGERHYSLRPMSMPEPNSRITIEELLAGPAVTLFLDRATAVRPELPRTRDDLIAIADLCRRLDGLPLAIELAAARSKAFSPQVMVARMEQRLPMLGVGPRDVPGRQQTMRDAIAWSYDLLSPADQTFFRRLAVFAGGFSLDAVEAVACSEHDGSDVLDRLSTLLDHNLVVQETGLNGDDRFSLLETIREFGLEQLASDNDSDAIRERHARWLVDLAAAQWRDLKGAMQAAALDVLQTEQANLRAATGWIAEHRRLDILNPDALDAVVHFLLVRGPLAEGQSWINDLLPMADPDSLERARLLNHAGNMLRHQRKFSEASSLFQESLAIFERLGDRAGRARVLHNIGISANQRSEYPIAKRYFEESLILFRELNDEPAIALGVYNLGVVAMHQGDLARGTELLTAALAAQRKLGDTNRVAFALYFLGMVAQREHDIERALALHEESVELWSALGSWQSAGHGVFWIGRVARLRGDLRRCVEVMIESIRLVQAEDDLWQIARCLLEIAVVAGAVGNQIQAARFLGAAERVRDRHSLTFHPDERAEYDRTAARARAELGDVAYTAERYAGAHLALTDLVTEASRLVSSTPAVVATETAPPKELAELTPRELDVLRLIAAGLTDREIADALSISHRTVHKHVARILDKLEVENRVAAQAYVRRLGSIM